MAKGSVAFKFDTKSLALFDPKKATARIKKLSKRTVSDMLITTSNNIKNQAPLGATGQLRLEINTELRPLSGRVFAGAPHAIIIERGRKVAPVAKSADPSLTAWLRSTRKGRRMLIIARKMMMKRRKTNPTTAQVIRSALFLMKRSMKRKKRKPNPFFTRGVEKATPFIKKQSELYIKDLAKALARP